MRNVYSVLGGYCNLKGLWRGTLGDCQHRNTAEKNNEHRITAKKVDETPTPQFNFCPTI